MFHCKNVTVLFFIASSKTGTMNDHKRKDQTEERTKQALEALQGEKRNPKFGSINYLVKTCSSDFFFLFKTGSHYITLVGLEFCVYQTVLKHTEALLPLYSECRDEVQLFWKLLTVVGTGENSSTEASGCLRYVSCEAQCLRSYMAN